MNGIEFAGKAERLHSADEGIGQRHAAFRRSAEHADGPRLEQRTEALQHGQIVVRRLGGASLERLPVAQNHAGIDRDESALVDHDRIDVEFGDVRLQPHQQPVAAADLHERVDQGGLVDRAPSAGAVEQRRTVEFAEHGARIAGIDRADAERDVLENLDEDAAETHHDHRPELRVAVAADDDLEALRRHFLDEPAVYSGRPDRRNSRSWPSRHRGPRPHP